MKSPIFLLVSVVCLWLIGLTAMAAPLDPVDLALLQNNSSNSLVTFQALITPRNFTLMGFHATNEVLQATNAEPLLVYTMPINRLRDYVTGEDVTSLLEPNPRQVAPRQVIIPIMVGTNVRSSTTLRFESPPGGTAAWTIVNWGQPKLIRRLTQSYQAVILQFPNAAPFAVEIPIFDLWLIGYYDAQNQLVLRSTSDFRLGPITIHRNQILTEAALERLAFTAQRYNGFPN